MKLEGCTVQGRGRCHNFIHGILKKQRNAHSFDVLSSGNNILKYSPNISIDSYTKWAFNEQKSYQNPNTYSGYSSQEKSKRNDGPSVGH